MDKVLQMKLVNNIPIHFIVYINGPCFIRLIFTISDNTG